MRENTRHWRAGEWLSGAWYCSTIWNSGTKDKILKIELVQRRAARYVFNRYGKTDSVSKKIAELGWESLESRREKTTTNYDV